MVATLEVVGAARLEETLAQAGGKLERLDTTDAARVIAARASQLAPRRTGRLASSIRSGQGTITSPLVYAVPVHWGRPAHNMRANPFVDRAADDYEHEWTQALEKPVQKVLDGVKGV